MPYFAYLLIESIFLRNLLRGLWRWKFFKHLGEFCSFA